MAKFGLVPWVVPDANPPPSAWNGEGYNDGLYNALHWVGIAGDIGAGADRVVQQTVLYLGEINDSQREQWIRAIEVFDEDAGAMDQLKLFAAERRLLTTAPDRVQVRLKDFESHRPRQWGGCWLFSELWKQLQLDEFWRVRLGCSREGTDWEHVLQTLVCYRLLDPGSEWRLHRVWFEHSAMGDLLAEDFSIVAKDTLYRCLDSLLEYKAELFEFLHQRWAALFGAKFGWWFMGSDRWWFMGSDLNIQEML